MTEVQTVPDRHLDRQSRKKLLIMFGMIACIDFSIELLIMLVLSRAGIITDVSFATNLLDPLVLTLLSSPLIYLLVVRPFALAAREANGRLQAQLEESRHLLEQNEKLRASLQAAGESTAETHEKILQRIGADLHDGPAQLLTYTLLQMNRLAPLVELAKKKKKITVDLDKMCRVTGEALREVRAISTGLSLPELSATSISETIALAVRRHEELTGSKVEMNLRALPASASLSQKICSYRFVQEALSNALKHGQSKTRCVKAQGGSEISITVQDDGLGFDPASLGRAGLGLTGMRARLQALGGHLDVQSAPGHGTRVTATFNPAAGRPA